MSATFRIIPWHENKDEKQSFETLKSNWHEIIHESLFIVTGRSRSDGGQSVSHSTDRDFTDVTLVSEDTYKRLG